MSLSKCLRSIAFVLILFLTLAGPAQADEPRHGGWLENIDMSVVSSGSAVSELQSNAIDVYATPLGFSQLAAIQATGLKYTSVPGSYYDIMYNPATCTDANKLNPFADRKIREATNRLYDRDYINSEIYLNSGLPKFFAIQTNGPDYADLADVARGLEVKYAFNETKAISEVTTEMTSLGATLVGGKWQYSGSLVTLIFLIRNDGDGTRQPMGNYAADQLEKAGFNVDRQYKNSSEALPIWRETSVECLWNVYTAGWASTGIERDDAGMFQQMYLPDSLQGTQPFLSNVPDPVFQQVGDDLANGNFTTQEQRHALMVQAMNLSLQDSLQVHIINIQSFAPYQTYVQVVADLFTGIETAPIAFYTARFDGLEGGTLKWGEADLFSQPWNPIAGSDGAWDRGAIAATSGGAFMADPYTGLQWPLRAESANLTVQTGLPVFKTLSWVKLTTASTIDVPVDAWADWDATTQTFITAGTKYPSGTTAKIKSTITYPSDMFKTVTWHDGSNLSVADFVMAMIMTFDRAKPASAIYDVAAVSNYESFMSFFKGVKIVSTNPLVIETYSDKYLSDAELNITSWWPNYGYGEAPWDVIAVANMAEAGGDIAYSPDKASTLGIDQTNFVGGPTLAALDGYLDEAITTNIIPYAPTMGDYISTDDASSRYAALAIWYVEEGHFWVGTGPYYLGDHDLVDKTLQLKNFEIYPDIADRWSGLAEPRIADASVTGPASVNAGDTPTFDISVTFKGDPYPNADILSVKYLLYDATSKLVETGPTIAVGEGQFQVTLSATTTSALAEGDSRIEAAVVVKPVVVPSFAHFDFLMVNLQPGSFSKTSPVNGATGQPANPTLTWGTSSGATSYQYCIDTTNDSTCNTTWTSTGTNTSVALSGLSSGTYYWAVRAQNAAGIVIANKFNGLPWWSFIVSSALPGAFSKTSPANGAIGLPANPTLTWGTSSGATSYQYCIDTINDSTCNTTWTSTETNSSVALSGLSSGTYHWAVRAKNAAGTVIANKFNGLPWWSFTVSSALPGAFSKTSPINGASGQPSNPTLRWGTSSGATSYQYCIDTTNDSTCNTTWISTGTNLSAALTGLTHGTYYWAVRARNAAGIVVANKFNGTPWWSFVVP